VQKYKSAEKDKTFPFSEWHRKDVFEKLIKNFLITFGYNVDQINYDDTKGTVELQIHKELRAIVYLSSIQEEQRFLSNKISAPIDTIPDPETIKPEYETAVVTNFEKWFFYFDGKEIYAIAGEKLESEYEILNQLISKDAIESGRFREIARKLIHKEDNEPLRQELNGLRIKIADRILREKINTKHLKNPDESYNNELLNEITTRWITRFLSLKLAEDSGISFNFTLRDVRRSFELIGKIAQPVTGAKVKEETLSNAIRALMNEFERRFNGGIFMYEEGVDYITVPDAAFFDLLDVATGWAFTIEDARIIGFVYERFLGQEIVVEERRGKPEAVLKNIGEARGRRKAGGIYYTPKYIVDYIVKNTLGEILEGKRKEIDNVVKNLDCEKFTSVLRGVKSLKVLDPACGSGSFLIKVLAEFKNFYDEVNGKAEEIKRKIDAIKREKTKTRQQMLFIEDKEILELEDKYSELQKEIDEIKFSGTFALRHNIYGVDLDPKAIDITAFTLMVQVYDELKEGARCPTMINENLKVGNSLVSAVTSEKRNGFMSRDELEKFKNEIANLIKLRDIEKGIDVLDDEDLKKLIEENFGDVIKIYLHIKERYPNAIPTPQQNLLDEWNRKAKKEPIEKTFDILIHQTGLARIFLKEVYFEKIRKIKEQIENEINRPLIRYFNSEKRVLRDREFDELLSDEDKAREELRFVKDRAMEISKSQPPKVFNWEIEFPEVFFDGNGLKENPGFDVAVGNPPWGRIKELPTQEEKYVLSEYFRSEIYSLQRGNINLYKLFLERAHVELKYNGLFSMIWPATFLGENDSIPLRIEIFENNTVKIVLHFPVPTVHELFDRQLIMEATVLTYQKQRQKDYEFSLKTEILIEEARNLKDIRHLKIKRNSLKLLSETYQIPIFKNMEKEWAILDKLGKYPKFGNTDNGKPIGIIGEGHLHETIDKKFMSEKPTGDLLIRGVHVRRYFIDLSPDGEHPRWVKRKSFLRHKPIAKNIIVRNPKIIGREMVHRDEVKKLHFTIHFGEEILSNAVRFIIIYDRNYDERFLGGLLNSQLLDWHFRLFSQTYHVKPYEIKNLPLIQVASNQQLPIISLVDAIITKKKEYHSINQNIENYIDFENTELIRLDEFLNKVVENFEVISPLKVKYDNFDVLQIKIEGKEAILGYGIRRKVEEYEIDEEEQEEIRSKHVVEWQEAGRGKIREKEAVEFLVNILEKEKRISKAKQKSIWQKIAEVKVPEFNDEIMEGFLKFKEAVEKAIKLDNEITRVDRAIDRLVYELYGLTEEEVKVVEKSVWGDKFNDMYSKLPPGDVAVKLSEEVKNGTNKSREN